MGPYLRESSINLWSHGGLCAPTKETLLFTLKCDQGFSKRYGLGRKVFQTVFWLMILKVFLMTTYFRMKTLWPHYNDDFMDFLLVYCHGMNRTNIFEYKLSIKIIHAESFPSMYYSLIQKE